MNLIDLKERIAIGGELSIDEKSFVLDAINAVSPPPGAHVHDPGNYLPRIEHMWAFLSSDPGGEGVCAAPIGPFGIVPMIAADDNRVASLKPTARIIASRAGKPVQLVKFTTREDIETYEP